MTPVTSIRAVEQKASMRRMFAANDAPPKALADRVGIAYQTLLAWADVSIDSHIPSARIPQVLALSSDRSLVSYWASLQHAVVVPLPTASAPDRCHLSDLMRRFAALLDAHGLATADDAWSADDAAQFRAVGQHLHACIAAQVLYAERQVRP